MPLPIRFSNHHPNLVSVSQEAEAERFEQENVKLEQKIQKLNSDRPDANSAMEIHSDKVHPIRDCNG